MAGAVGVVKELRRRLFQVIILYSQELYYIARNVMPGNIVPIKHVWLSLGILEKIKAKVK